MDDFEKDIEEWENSFYCNECDNDEIKDFTYQRTAANGEVWVCDLCRNEVMVEEQPNEDNY